MISADTNILVRAFLGDHLIQARQAEAFLEKMADAQRLFISSYALLEMVWVLKTKKYERQLIYEALLDLLDSPGVMIGQRSVVAAATELFIKGKADFGDYMIIAEGMENNCHSIATFDQALAQEVVTAKSPEDFITA